MVTLNRYTALHGNIDGANYPPKPGAVWLATCTSYLWFFGIALIFAGETIFATLGISEPWWFAKVKENRVATFMVLFVLNNIGNSQLATGAFEIYLDGDLLFSKLTQGRLPNAEDLVEALAKKGFGAGIDSF